jgi:hypothetical protein
VSKKRKKVSRPTPPVLDPDKFLHAWHLACASADGEVRPLHGMAGKEITLRDGKETLTLHVNDRPETRFLDAIGTVFSRDDGIAATTSAVARMIGLFGLIAERKVPRWVHLGDDGTPMIHEALVLGAAQAKLVRHKALEMYRERFAGEEP